MNSLGNRGRGLNTAWPLLLRRPSFTIVDALLQGRKHLLVTAHLENSQTNKQASADCEPPAALGRQPMIAFGGDRQLEGIQSFDRLIDKSPGILSLLMNLMNSRRNHRLKTHKRRMVVALINRL